VSSISEPFEVIFVLFVCVLFIVIAVVDKIDNWPALCTCVGRSVPVDGAPLASTPAVRVAPPTPAVPTLAEFALRLMLLTAVITPGFPTVKLLFLAVRLTLPAWAVSIPELLRPELPTLARLELSTRLPPLTVVPGPIRILPLAVRLN